MDRKQQLEAMGRDCVQVWAGRMAAVQALPAMPQALLQDALPAYRLWLGELAQMHHGWMQVTDGGSALLDPMMPWHWLGIGKGLAAEASASDGRETPHTQSPYPVLPPTPLSFSYAPITQKPAEFHSQELHASSKSQSIPNRDLAHPDVQQESWRQSQVPQQDTQIAARLFPEKPSSEPAKQVIFRGLDDFASFVQNPNAPAQFAEADSATEAANIAQNAPLKKDARLGNETQQQGDMHRNLEQVQSQQQDHQTAFHPLQPQAAVAKPLQDAPAPPSTWDQLQASLMQLQQQHVPPLHQPQGQHLSPIHLDGSAQLDNARNPLQFEGLNDGQIPRERAIQAVKGNGNENALVQSHSQPLPGKEQFKIAPATQSENDAPAILAEKSRLILPSSQPEDSLWGNLQASWAQLGASPSSIHQQHISASKALFAATKMQHTRQLLNEGGVSQSGTQEQAVDKVTAQPTPQYVDPNRAAAELPTNTPEAQLPLAISTPIWPSGEKSVASTWDNSRSVAEFMEAMTEQLQRDFKRYYGA